MAYDSLDPQDTTAPVRGDGASVDASKSKIHQAWDAFNSNPANSAALLQFGIAMMQPRAPGQSGIGAAANAIGEAGGAAGRATAAQTAEDTQAASLADQESKRGLQEAQSAATTSNAATTAANAAAYGRSVDAVGGGGASGGVKGALAAQKAFNSWLMKPTDNTGLTADPIVAALQRKFPEIKTKGDVLANPAAKLEARRLFDSATAQAAEGDAEDPAAAAPPAAAPPPASPVRRFSADGKQFVEWDGSKWSAPQPVR